MQNFEENDACAAFRRYRCRRPMALAQLEARSERPYYDAEADSRSRAEYYAGIDVDSPPEAPFHEMAALVQTTHRSPLAYRPAELVYPWVDLHPDRRLRSIYSGKPFDADEFIRADADIARRRTARLQGLVLSEFTLGPAKVRGRL